MVKRNSRVVEKDVKRMPELRKDLTEAKTVGLRSSVILQGRRGISRIIKSFWWGRTKA